MTTTYPYYDGAPLEDIFVVRALSPPTSKPAPSPSRTAPSSPSRSRTPTAARGSELKALASSTSIVTAAKFRDTEQMGTYGELGSYSATITVITEAGELNLANAEGDASNGYYLHGFALDITVSPPGEHLESGERTRDWAVVYSRRAEVEVSPAQHQWNEMSW
jgi:hypothetical protein